MTLSCPAQDPDVLTLCFFNMPFIQPPTYEQFSDFCKGWAFGGVTESALPRPAPRGWPDFLELEFRLEVRRVRIDVRYLATMSTYEVVPQQVPLATAHVVMPMAQTVRAASDTCEK